MRIASLAVVLVGVLFLVPSVPANANSSRSLPTRWAHHPAVAPFGIDDARLPGVLYLVRTRGDLSTGAGVTVHAKRGSLYLVSGDPDAVSRLAGHGCSVSPVPAGPVAAPPARAWTTIDEPDPAIAAMVEQVEWESIDETVRWLADFGTRFSFARNHRHVAESIAARFESMGLEPTMRDFVFEGATMWNVEATHPGAVDSLVIICGHFDSISERPAFKAPGADDNGTGMAAVLETASILSQYDFRYSIRFIGFSGEEQILRGSQAYALWAHQNNLPIVGVLNYDMIGWWEPGVPRNLEIETNQASQWLASAIVNAADLYTDAPYLLHVYDGAWWGDHASFWAFGYAGINNEESWDWYDPDFNPRYHTTQDLPEYVHPEFATDNVKVAVASLATVAGYLPRPVAFELSSGEPKAPINPKSHGVTPALLRGADAFDAHTVDLSSLIVEGVAPVSVRVGERTGDGIDDISMKFDTAELAAAMGHVPAKHDVVTMHLTGNFRDGTRLAGECPVTVVGNTAGGPQHADLAGLPETTALGEAVPNPFNPVTRIPYALARDARVTVTVYDVVGRVVARLVDGARPAGEHVATWNATGVSSGVYFCRFVAEDVVDTRRLVLLK